MNQWTLTSTLLGHMLSPHKSLSSDGKKVVAVNSDHCIRIFDVPSGRPLVELRGHEGTIRQANFSTDDRTVISASPRIIGERYPGDGTVRVWDAVTGLEAAKISHEYLNSVKLAPDGRYAALLCLRDSGRTCGNSFRNIIDLRTTARVRHFCGHDIELEGPLCFSPSSKLFFSFGEYSINAWRITTGELAFRIDAEDVDWRPENERFEVRQFVEDILFSPAGQIMAVRFGGRPVEIWDYRVGLKLQELPASTIGAEIVDFSIDGERLIVSIKDSFLQIFNVKTGQPIARLWNTDGRVWSRFTPDGRYVVASADYFGAEICDADSGDVLLFLKPPIEDKFYNDLFRHGSGIPVGPRIAITPDGKHILTGERAIHIWSKGLESFHRPQ